MMKEYRPLVSCIVPVYNAGKYLQQGIESLLSQTYSNLEIVLVDDKSTDNSWEICQNYSRTYDNVRAFQNKLNSGGPLRGREKGIRVCTGEWITFMDGDDYVGPDYIANLVRATCDGKYDIAVTGHSRLHIDGTMEDFLWENNSQTTDQRLAAFYNNFLEHNFWTDPMDTVGQSLTRASICKASNLSEYTNLIYAEDTLMALVFLSNSKNGINFIDNHDFVWRQVEGSGSHGGFSERANKNEFFEACLKIFHMPSVYSRISQGLPLVSIIVPVYNVEKYLEDCLASITGQSYKNIEVIVINDGATDESQKIIDKYRRHDSRIVALKQKNKGLNMARSSGVEIARGDYISFIDSDDMVHRDYIQLLYENLLTNAVDISLCGFSTFTNDTGGVVSEAVMPNYAEQVIREKENVINYLLGAVESVPNIHQMTAWGKLYSASIVKKTDWHFSNYRRYEDTLESLQWFSRAKKGIAAISTPLYFYRVNPLSITGTKQDNIGPDGEKLNYFEFLYELYKKTKNYLHDDVYNIAITNRLAHSSSIQARNFLDRGWLDDKNINSVIDNWGELIKIYNVEISSRDDMIRKHQDDIHEIQSSWSWRITKPARLFSKTIRKALKGWARR